MRIGEDMLDQPVASAAFRIGESVENAISLRVFYLVIQIALFLVAECFPVADHELKIARVRLIERWIVEFVDDAMAEREPKPAACVIGGAQTCFGTGRPTRLDSGRAEGDGGVIRWVSSCINAFPFSCRVPPIASAVASCDPVPEAVGHPPAPTCRRRNWGNRTAELPATHRAPA